VSAKEAWGKEQGARELGVGWVEPVPRVMGFALSITFLCLPGYSKLTMKAIPTNKKSLNPSYKRRQFKPHCGKGRNPSTQVKRISNNEQGLRLGENIECRRMDSP
jgi:hypothetical protein